MCPLFFKSLFSRRGAGGKLRISEERTSGDNGFPRNEDCHLNDDICNWDSGDAGILPVPFQSDVTSTTIIPKLDSPPYNPRRGSRNRMDHGHQELNEKNVDGRDKLPEVVRNIVVQVLQNDRRKLVRHLEEEEDEDFVIVKTLADEIVEDVPVNPEAPFNEQKSDS